MNQVMWFDIPARDLDASTDFYGKVFGWHVLARDENDSGNALSFRLAQTSPSTLPHQPDRPGAINGGIVTRDIGISQPTILIEVENLEEKLATLVAAGGQAMTARKALPLAGGYFAYAQDPDGNVIGLWEPMPA